VYIAAMKPKQSKAKRHNVTLYESQEQKAIRCSKKMFKKPNISGFIQYLIDEHDETKTETK